MTSPGLFDILKKGYTQATGEQEAGVLPSIGFGVFSSFTGQLVAYPLETVVRQMQVHCALLPNSEMSLMVSHAYMQLIVWAGHVREMKKQGCREL